MPRLAVFRRYARAIAVLLLLLGPAGIEHGGRDDFACAPAGSSSDGPVVSRAPDDAPEHCPVCHWTRSLRSAFASAIHVESAATRQSEVALLQPVAHRAPALDRLPARAPPRSL